VKRSVGVSSNPVRQYLDEAGRHQLLDREREADLSKRFRAGVAADELLRDTSPTRATAARLRRISREGRRPLAHHPDPRPRLGTGRQAPCRGGPAPERSRG